MFLHVTCASGEKEEASTSGFVRSLRKLLRVIDFFFCVCEF